MSPFSPPRNPSTLLPAPRGASILPLGDLGTETRSPVPQRKTPTTVSMDVTLCVVPRGPAGSAGPCLPGSCLADSITPPQRAVGTPPSPSSSPPRLPCLGAGPLLPAPQIKFSRPIPAQGVSFHSVRCPRSTAGQKQRTPLLAHGQVSSNLALHHDAHATHLPSPHRVGVFPSPGSTRRVDATKCLREKPQAGNAYYSTLLRFSCFVISYCCYSPTVCNL